ncbi:MAG: hypothetical protein JOZ69_12875, partial [Myxococcales bacterium]|nr:hypothetical protein [Myxococcales bacterium]
MRSRDWFGALALALGLMHAPPALAADEGDSDDEPEMPAGHPAVDDGNPHGRAGAGSMPGVFEPPADTETQDPTLPPSTIAVDLRDADDHPVPHVSVTLGAIISSVAKGDSRKHFQATTDDHGRALFTNLDTASSIAYRVSASYQGGTFAATPFRLEPAKPIRVVLHVYPVVHDLQGTLVVVEATLAGEVRDDRIQLEEVLTFYNLGRTAWQPEGVRFSLPETFKALNAQPSMSGQGVDEVAGGVQLRGTFAPGRHVVQFQWQYPWGGDEKDVDFAVGLPPHVAVARVVMPMSTKIDLSVVGFPPAQIRHDGQGQRFLVTERSMRPEDPKLTALSVRIHGLPTAGPDRIVATLLAGCVVAAGLALSLSRRGPSSSRKETRAARSVLLEELADLERARSSGEVGPKTYERV